MVKLPAKKHDAISYADYILDHIEWLSIVMLVVTAGLYFYAEVGLVLSMLPCLVFHCGAYVAYRRFVRPRCLLCLDKGKLDLLQVIAGGGELVRRDVTMDCPECGDLEK